MARANSSARRPQLPAPDPPEERRPVDRRAILILAAVCLLVYNANLRTIGASDTVPARNLPFGIWHSGSVLLDPVLAISDYGMPKAFILPSGELASVYPIVLPVLVSPLYGPAVAYLHHEGWDEDRFLLVALLMEKLVSSCIATAAVALLFLALRRCVSPRAAFVTTVAFAFGTNTWVVGSQAFWQHGLAELLFAGVLLVLSGPPSAWRAAVLGCLLCLAVGNRPPDVIPAAALGLYGLWWARRRWPLLFAGAAVPGAFLYWYNVLVIGDPLGSYSKVSAAFFEHPWAAGLAGLMLSPGRGLLVFTPFLIFLPLGAYGHWKTDTTRRLAVWVTIGVALQVLFYARTYWVGGVSWGPRFLTDLLPLLVWLLAPAADLLRPFGFRVLELMIVVSIAIQVIGAFWYIGAADLKIAHHATNGADGFKEAWNPDNTPFLVELQHRRPPLSLRSSLVVGGIDSIAVNGSSVEEIPCGEPVTVEGWALERDIAPPRVMVRVGTTLCGITDQFFDRPGAESAPSGRHGLGWRMTLDRACQLPGRHLIEALGNSAETTQWFPFAHRRVNFCPSP